MARRIGTPTRSEGIVDADVGVAGVDTLVIEEIDADWLPDVSPGFEAPAKEELKLDDDKPELEEVEPRPVGDKDVLVEVVEELVPLVNVPREEVLEVTPDVPVDVDPEPLAESESVLLDD